MNDCKITTMLMEAALKLSAKSDSKLANESTYRQLMGSLIYLTATRLDLSFRVSHISRFMTTPKAEHWTVTKRILKYVKDTTNMAEEIISG